MRGCRAVNLVLCMLLAAGGCKISEKSRRRGEPPVSPTARDKQPSWLDPSAQLPGAQTGVPKGAPWSQTSTAASDALGGRVVDTFGRPVKNVFIRIEPLPALPGGAMGIYSDDQGYFLTRGLKPGQSYQLTAEAHQQGRPWRGTVQTKVPNTTLTLVLREVATDALDSGPPGTDNPTSPPAVEPRSRSPRVNRDGAFQPDGGEGMPVPPSLPPGRRPAETGGAAEGSKAPVPPTTMPPPQNLAPPLRPEHTADGPRPPYTPPPVSIPGPPSLPSPPPPPPLPKLPVPPTGTSAPSQSGKPFTVVLVDSLQRPWTFPGDSSARLVILEFITTDCPHCRLATPLLKDLQARYATAGLQVVAVLCDELPLLQRLQAAQRYTEFGQLNYPVYVEPGPAPGRVRDAFAVEGYPTVVVLNAHGQLVWKGHPGQKTELERIIRQHLQP